MSRENNQMAYVAEVTHLIPIKDADKIEKAIINRGWPVVVRKGEYKVGDHVIYLEIDSWVPLTLAPFLQKGDKVNEYNGVPGERLRTVKLRGATSQGLILPLTFPAEKGDKLGDVLGIQKWNPPIDAALQGTVRGPFPNFIRKTDQLRWQNLVKEITEEINKDTLFECSLKLDGTSCTVYNIGVCSRNLDLMPGDNLYYQVAKRTGLLKALEDLNMDLAVQGEIVGPRVNGNRGKYPDNQLFIFDIYSIEEARYLSYPERMGVMSNLFSRGYTGSHVPSQVRTLKEFGINSVEDFRNYFEGANDEGVVFKRFDGQFSFKVINDAYLLKYKE